MATKIDVDNIKEATKLIELYEKYITKLAQDKKGIDKINSEIAAQKSLQKEFKVSLETLKKIAAEKAEQARVEKMFAEEAKAVAANATGTQKELADAIAVTSQKRADDAAAEAKAAEQSLTTLQKSKTTVQELRKARKEAATNVEALFEVWEKGSNEAMGVVTELYDKVGTNSKAIAAKEKEKIQGKIDLLKTNEALDEAQKEELKTLQKQLNTINATEKAEANRRKELENYVNIINSGVKMSMTIVGDLMKFTPLGSKAADRKSKKEVKNEIDLPNTGNTDVTDVPSTENAPTADVPATAITPEPAAPAPAPGSEDSEANMTEDQKTANLKKNHEERINSAVEYAEAASEIASQLNSFLDEIDAQRMQKLQTQYDEDLAALNEKLANGQLSEEEYSAQKLALEEKLAKDKAKIEREQAIRKKAMGIFQVGVDMAVGIMKAWTDVPVWASIVYTVAIAAMGAAQIAAISAAPLPKARKGGLIVGNSHENGGVLIEAEGGEAILSREAMEAFPGMAQLMNAAASGSIYDGGYAARSVLRTAADDFASADGNTVNIDYKKLAAAITESLKEMKIFVAVTDINDGLKQYVQLDEMAKI